MEALQFACMYLLALKVLVSEFYLIKKMKKRRGRDEERIKGDKEEEGRREKEGRNK